MQTRGKIKVKKRKIKKMSHNFQDKSGLLKFQQRAKSFHISIHASQTAFFFVYPQFHGGYLYKTRQNEAP